jgi:3-hydroxyacyl-CoA dehydrogenase / 3-hydroxy-2-methylbutyryl-CoA dehydrogenase
MNIKNAAAVVTGGASGLGEAALRAIIARGGRAAILDIADEKGARLVAELGDAVMYCRTDVTSEADVVKALEAAAGKFGAVNVVVNSAGIAPSARTVGKKGPADLAEFERVIRINLIGTFNVIRLAAAKMAGNAPGDDGERGVIVNTASIAAYEGQIGQAAYAASKAGVVGMTLPVARDLAGYGIRNVTIAPGIFDTPMMATVSQEIREALGKSIPFPQRMGRPDEFSALVVHIIENSFLNGETIRLDGAIRMAAK